MSEQVKRIPQPKMVERKCERCSGAFQARAADVKRGWGRFCSKSCKASEQEKRTVQNRAHVERRSGGMSQWERDELDHEAALDGMTDSEYGASDGGYHTI